MTAQLLHDHLLHRVFARVIGGDAEMAEQIRRFDGAVYFDGSDLLFTLPDLYSFVLSDFGRCEQTASRAGQIDYKTFRRMLYTRDTNTLLRQYGAVVVIAQAHDDHTLSVYRLTTL